MFYKVCCNECGYMEYPVDHRKHHNPDRYRNDSEIQNQLFERVILNNLLIKTKVLLRQAQVTFTDLSIVFKLIGFLVAEDFYLAFKYVGVGRMLKVIPETDHAH